MIELSPVGDGDDALLLLEKHGLLDGGRRSLLAWQRHNPFGRAPVLLAFGGGEPVGVLVLFRWEVTDRTGRPTRALRIVESWMAPHVERGDVFKRLADVVGEYAGDVEILFDVTRRSPGPGWERRARLPVWVKPRPLGLVRSRRGHVRPSWSPPPDWRPASEVPEADLRDMAGNHLVSGRPHTRRTPSYLHWRYGRSPISHFLLTRDDRTLVCHLRDDRRVRELVVVDAFGRDELGLRHLLAAAARDCEAARVLVSFPEDHPAGGALRWGWWVRLPGPSLFVRPVRGGAARFASRETWSLTLGDIRLP